MARPSKLTTMEKYAIQGMIHDKKSIEDIAEAVNRPIKTVQNYVDKELSELHATIVNAQLQQSDVQAEQPEQTNQPAAVERITCKQLFARNSKNGSQQEGVTVMTPAASERGDEARKKHLKIANRHMDGNVYRISDQKVLRNGDNIKEE